MMAQLKVLELFSGIGGMHLALKESQISASIVAAVDINTAANAVYKHNFPGTKLLQRNIEALTAKEIENLQPDMIVLSPPCQPFTRRGKQEGLADSRSMALIHFMELIPKLWGVRYVLLENVVGFESSVACKELVQILQENLFETQQFHLCPTQFHIPNSRKRFYLLAKRKPWKFQFETTKLEEELPVDVGISAGCEPRPACEPLHSLNSKYTHMVESSDQCFQLSKVLEQLQPEERAAHAVPDKLLERYVYETDFVIPDDVGSCCFTKAYRRFFHGSGSVLTDCSRKQFFETFDQVDTKVRPMSPEHVSNVRSIGPRFFTPREIMRLMGFPEDFTFPSHASVRQASAMLGNSINVHVVALLILYLTEGDLILD
ncbi:hypothetical protein B566_EDAN012764 [Ephemera danica]|nr:hypothetical protein B566_EDAN012764 [Ephemera danica]